MIFIYIYSLQDVSMLIPDPSLPLDVQLTNALETVAKQTNAIKDLQGQVKVSFQIISY